MDLSADQRILEKLRTGHSEEAFQILIDLHQHNVYRLALSLTGDPYLAEEVAQETFVRAWKYIGKFRGESGLGTWLFSICRNRSYTVLERNAKRREVSSARIPDRPHEVTANHGELLEALQQLEGKHREAVTLYYFAEQSYEEVSRTMGVPLGTVKTYLHRAKKSLAEWLEQRKVARHG